MSEIIVARDIDIVTAEIKTIEMQVAKTAIYGCIEIGKRLMEAKEMVGHGNWGKYLEEKVRYSQQWATNLMNLYKEYGQNQQSLFDGFANSQSFGNIDVTKHILLLAVPAEDRAEFAEENDVENKSVQELKAALKERDEAARAAQEAEDEAKNLKKKLEETADQLDIAGDKLLAKEETIRQLNKRAEEAGKEQAQHAAKVDELQLKLEKAVAAEKAAKDALKAARENPEIPEAMMEEMRQQVAADAAAQATADLRKQLEEAQTQAAKAAEEQRVAEEKAVAAQKAVQLANPDAAVFKLLFGQVQEDFNKLQGALLKVQQNDPATGGKLKAAMVTLLEKLMADLAG